MSLEKFSKFRTERRAKHFMLCHNISYTENSYIWIETIFWFFQIQKQIERANESQTNSAFSDSLELLLRETSQQGPKIKHFFQTDGISTF